MLSIVIPAFNEQDGIVATIERAREVCEGSGINNAEIIVINDGSSDKTAEFAEASKAKVIHHLENMGYGRSLKDGIEKASFDTIVIIDADGTYPIERIPELLKHYQRGFDMVVGQRQGKFYDESWLKRPLRQILRFLVEFTTGRKIPDINSGFRIFSKRTVQSYSNQLCNTFSFTTSMTLAYLLTAKVVAYIPIEYHMRIGEKKVRLFKDSLRTLQYIVQAALYYNPLKIFLLFAALIFSGSILVIALASVAAQFGLLLLGVGGVLVSALILAFGLMSDQLRQITASINAAAEVASKRQESTQTLSKDQPSRRVVNL